MSEKKKHVYTRNEEIANVISHGIMAALCLLILPFAAIKAYIEGGALDAIGVSIFVISILLMFLASTLYHSMEKGTRFKRIFQIFDHIFIYVAIAGSYTPIALSVIGGWQGIFITVIQWSMVTAGILHKTLSRKKEPKSNVTIYLIMGWTIIIFLPVLLKKAGIELISMIVVGGLFYSVGAFIYKKKAFKYHHMIWHLFVSLGALSHFIGIVFFLR